MSRCDQVISRSRDIVRPNPWSGGSRTNAQMPRLAPVPASKPTTTLTVLDNIERTQIAERTLEPS